MTIICFNLSHVGVGFYSPSSSVSIVNNTILETDSEGRISSLLCLSGTNMSAVGDWLGPGGRSLITTQNDPFDVIFGDDSNPGQLVIDTPTTNPSITSTHEGVYTCVLPDDNDETEYLHIGIYLSGSSSKCTVNHFKTENEFVYSLYT